MTARPLYLETEPDPVFGFFHAAPRDRQVDVAVLICPPFGWEDVSSYRSRRAWAEHLARAGRPALRFDLPGTGDSGGAPRDPARLAAWTSATGQAARWLRGATGAGRVVAVGPGLGGFVAYLAAADGAPIDDLVLWAVPARGRSLARELRAFAKLKASEFPDREGPEPPPLPEGFLDVAGFLVTPETRGALESTDLTAVELPAAVSRRVLLLDRDGTTPDERLRSHLEAAGASVTVAAGPGYGAMTAGPQGAKAPTDVFRTVDAWLAAAGAAPARAAGEPHAPRERSTVELGRVRETPITIDGPRGRLFGILSERVDAPRSGLCVVLLNGGAVRRIGPNRMWVEAARRWAATGVSTLRLDIEGLGDSDGDGARYADTAALYTPAPVDDVRAALDALESRGVAASFVVGGLCAGGYWSFQTILRDARVRAALLVNLGAFFWNDSIPTARDVRRIRRLASPFSWLRILRGEVKARQVRAILGWLIRTPFELRTRRVGRNAEGRLLDDAFDQLREAGQRITIILGRGEPVLDELARDGRLERLDRWPNVRLHRIPGRDHTFRANSLQRQVHAFLDDALDCERRGGGRVETFSTAAP